MNVCNRPEFHSCIVALRNQQMDNEGMILCGAVVAVVIAILVSWRIFK
jgi:hypothetical protein